MTIASAADYATGDGVTDATAGLRKAIAANSALFLPPDKRFLISGTLEIDKPFTLVGAGTGAGPGLVSTMGCSQIVCAPGFTSGDAIHYSSIYAGVFRDFQIASADGLSQTSVSKRGWGAGLHIDGPRAGPGFGGTNMCSRVENVAFSGFNIQLQCTLCEDQIVRGCYFQGWGNTAYYVDNGATATECSAGHVTQNKFFGDGTAGTAQQFGILTRHGYTTIADNLIVGSQVGVALVASEHSIGNLFIKDNSLEEQTIDSVIVMQVAPNRIGSVQITGNEFSNLGNTGISSHVTVTGVSSADLFNVDISDNNFYSFMQGGSASCIDVQFGSNVTVHDNRMTINKAYAVILGTNVTAHSVRDNMVQGSPTGSGYYP